MNKKELINAIAAHTEVDAKTVGVVVAGMQDVVFATVAKKENVVVSGWFKASLIQRSARVGRNPATGAPVTIKAKKVAKMTPLKAFKDTALGEIPAPKLKTGPAKSAPSRNTPVKKAAPATKATAKAATKAPVKKAPVKAAPVKKAPVKKAATKR
jgi:DNA-binding protein HU-beta